MDVHMQSNSSLQFGTNKATGHNHTQDDELKFLSQEVKDTLQYFEQTIDLLEQSLEEDELKPQLKSCNDGVDIVDGASITSPQFQTTPANPKEHINDNIIDLVRSKPDLVQTKETPFTNPDFQSLIPAPESHIDIKPHSDSADSLPSEYNVPLTDSPSGYHPPGSIPTPVLIAHKIAENQAGPSSILTASSILRRRSSEFDKSTSTTNKYGPPTSAKPSRYPANISVILGNREHQNDSLSNVSIEERRAQMLANLSGTSHPLLQEDSLQDPVDKVRKTPTRSVSFRDPTPEKSRMEALSKLGLSRNRALSGGVSLPSSPLQPLVGAEANTQNLNLPEHTTVNVAEPSTPPVVISSTVQQPSSPSHLLASSKPQEINSPPKIVPMTTPQEPSGAPNVVLAAKTAEQSVPTSSRLPVSPVQSYVERRPEIQTENRYSPPPVFSPDDFYPPPPPPVETSAEFNTYGGKSVVVSPPVSSKSELPSSPVSPEPKQVSPALTNPSEFNPYGGKSKIMTPVPVAVTRRDLPDILSSHIDKSQTLHGASDVSTEANSYGGKSHTFNSSVSSVRPSELLSRTLKPPAPTPAPRPARHSYHGGVTAQKSPQRALSPEQRGARKGGPMFRPQGITVQFSGKGATDESRREALRKLGLLKD